MRLVPAVKRILALRCTIHRGYVSATRDTRVPIRQADISFTGLLALAVCIRNKAPSAVEFNARISADDVHPTQAQWYLPMVIRA
jgi:phosphoribosylamine-glycine ligase